MPDEKTNSNHELIENYDDVTWLYNWWPMVKSNFKNLLDWVTAHINGTGDRHSAADIDYNSGTVEDGLITLSNVIEIGLSELADADAENCKYTIHQSYDVDISKAGSGNNVLYITIDGVTSYSQMSGKAVAINTGIYQCTFSSPSPVYVNVNGLGNKALRRPLPYDYADYDTKQYYTDKYCYGEIGRHQTLIVYYDGSNFILTNVAVPTKATKAIELESTDDSSYTTPKAVGVIAGKVKDDIGDLDELNTTNKSSIVGAINSVLSFATSGVDEDELLAALSIEFFNPNAYSIGLANLTKTGNKTYKADVTLSGAYIANKIMNESKDYGMNKTYKDFHFSVNDLDRFGLWIDIDMLQNRSEVCQLFEFDLGDGSEPAEGYLDANQYLQFHLCDFEIYDGDSDNPSYTAYNGYTSGVINMFEVVGGYLNTKAEMDHASSYTGYGLGDDVNYGHVKLSDSTSSTSGTSGGTAATPAAVKAAYDKAVSIEDYAQHTSTVFVAAANARAESKSGADYVCTGTNDEETIQAAINSIVSTGGVIQLSEGTFYFSNNRTSGAVSGIALDSGIALKGAGSSTVINTYNTSGFSDNPAIGVTGSDNVTISDMLIMSGDYKFSYSIDINGSSNVEVNNIIFTLQGSDSGIFRIYNSSDVNVINSRFEVTESQTSISVTNNSKNILIKNNVFNVYDWEAVNVYGASNVIIDGNFFKETYSNTGNSAISVNNALSNIMITNNVIDFPLEPVKVNSAASGKVFVYNNMVKTPPTASAVVQINMDGSSNNWNQTF